MSKIFGVYTKNDELLALGTIYQVSRTMNLSYNTMMKYYREGHHIYDVIYLFDEKNNRGKLTFTERTV